MPRRKSKKDKRVVEQYEYVKVGKSKTKTKRTKKPKGSGDVVQTVIIQAPGRRRRAAKPKAEVWQPMAAPLVQQVVQPTQVPYQFRSEPAAPIMPVAAAPPKVEQPKAPAAFQPEILRPEDLQTTAFVKTEPEDLPPVFSEFDNFFGTLFPPKAKETKKMETKINIPEAFVKTEPAPSMFDLTDVL